VEILRERGVEFDAIEYLKSPFDEATLRRILGMLESPPKDLVRKDKRFAELGLREEDYVTADQVVAVLLKHPELTQRPIVVRGERAIIARPGESVTSIL
jgi:arsenate reductase